jgi:hypothetical protein
MTNDIGKLETAEPRASRTQLMGNAYKDLLHAIENDRFAIETPRVHVGIDDLDRVSISIERDTEHHMGEIQMSSPYITLEIEWYMDTERGAALFSDLRKHTNIESPCVLHGDIHLWEMSWPQARRIEQSAPMLEQEQTDGQAEIAWKEIAVNGWI